MKLTTYKDNGGRYHWQLATADGTAIAGSIKTYASREEARGAAQQVYDQAASMTIETS